MSHHPCIPNSPTPLSMNRICRIYAGVLCLLLSACTLAPQQFTEKQAIDVNEAVGKTEDDLILLNIVRAELREPLVFTNYAQFTEALPTTNLTLSLTAPSVQQTAGTGQFTANAMDRDQQYLAEVTTPVTPATLKYYYDQGWPTSLLLHLFVGEIRVMHGEGDFERYSNYPYDLQSYQAFDLLANELSGCRFSVKATSHDAAQNAHSLPVFVLSAPTVSVPNGRDANVAAQACDAAIKSGPSSLTLCDPNVPEGARKDCMDFVYRSPAQVVTYIGDIMREQWFSSLNAAPAAQGPKILGLVNYSDACFYRQRQDGNETPESCDAYCDAIFVMNDMSRDAADAKGMSPQCEWAADPGKVRPFEAPEKLFTQAAGENASDLTVTHENINYELPLNYLNHTETLHTLEIVDLLMGYQVGVNPGSNPPKAGDSAGNPAAGSGKSNQQR